LDNAADAAQVRPLLPASPQCLVIVTSRRELAALAAREGARLLQLDVLSELEANELLVARLGKERAAGEPWAVTELATLCARLPLALSVVVARAAASPKLPLSSLSAELTELGGRLDGPDACGLISRAGCSASSGNIIAAAAASIAGVTLAQARVQMRALIRRSLIMC